jgi:Secretion system C-terminal sorting domain
MKNWLIVGFLVTHSVCSFSQTITVSAISGSPFCAGASFNITYGITGTFGGGNVFTAQLSDASGSFGTPTNIGSATTIFAGQITVTIPASQSAGTQYRIRVVGSAPSVIGTNNGSDLVIKVIDLNAPTFAGTTFCPGASFALNFSLLDCDFISGNTFTAQLSDAAGSFTSPTLLQSTTTTQAGSYTITIPTTTPPGTQYRIRLISSSPARVSPDNGTNITVSAYGINAPTFSATSFCQGESVNIGYTIQNACSFPILPSSNVFTAQLSNSVGSFASPVNIGSIGATGSGSIQATIPVGTPGGAGYRIRVVSSNPTVIVGSDNGSNLTVNVSSGNPAIFGMSSWNVYAYIGTASPISNNALSGTYTEDNLNFDTRNRWDAAIGPSVADASSGAGYQGCPMGGTNYSMSFKRTNFTCGYYQIDIPFQDDGLTLFVDGVQVFQNNSYTPGLQASIWKGFLGPGSTVEFQLINFGGGGRLQVAFNAAPNPLTISDPAIICATSSTNLSVSSALSLSYVWTPTTGLTPANGLGASVDAAPTSTTTYTATGTDGLTGCSISRDVLVTVTPSTTVPNLTLTNVPQSICPGITTSTLTVSGANTYTWSPSTGLSASTGSKVTANPSTSTTYTVTGTTGCQNAIATATVTVEPVPTNPSAVFGDGTWNVYCHNNTSLSNYYGFYTEDNLNFNTTSRWTSAVGPTGANAASGLAYSGCSFGSTIYSLSFKRTNFTCGYYQIDIPFQDDGVKLLINGVQVFQNNNYTPAPQTNVWTGFLGPTTNVEIQLFNYQLFGQLEISINPSPSLPQILNTNSNICVGTAANLSATSPVSGATYAWSVDDPSGTISFTPSASVSTPLFQTTGATPAADYTVTNTLTDAAGTGCSTSRTFTVAVSILPNTTVTPSAATNTLTACTNAGVTLMANGANTYNWSPSTGLSATTGFSVVATPLVTTTYTVTGSNNCASNSATATITVSPLPAASTFGAGAWHVYGFNSTTVGTNYEGYYTEKGFGATGLDFDTRTRWAISDVPSNANASNGLNWQGCALNPVNTSLSFKRTGFACGVYQLDVPSHADGFALFINGTQVAEHNGCCDSHTNVWMGTLNSNSTVEWQLFRNSTESHLQVAFTVVPLLASTTFPSGGWNVYGFNSTTIGTNYQGYYTESGSGASGLDFDTRSRWAIDDALSNVNGFNGATWQGCAMSTANTSMSFKRTGFTCGAYQLNVSSHADDFKLFIDGTEVAQHAGCCDSHSNVWTGILNSSSTVEWQLFRNSTESHLQVTFTPVSLLASTTFPTDHWNVYGFNSATIGTDYKGYYTEGGSGSTGLNFDTRTRWASNDVPSNANDLNGITWEGCAMNAVNTSLSFKRTGFTCAVYQLDVPSHADGFKLLIDGVEVAQHTSCCDSHTNVWTGTLNPTSTMEWQLMRNSAESYLQVTFTVIPLLSTTNFSSGSWNVFGFNSTTIGTNYSGYYTENGSGATGLDFDTRTRWLSDKVPSDANDLNGAAWQGCPMYATSTSMSFKRTGFTCGVYRLGVPSHADGFLLFVDGTQVGQHTDCCDSHANVWTGTLNSGSTVEWQLFRNSSESYLQVSFTSVSLPSPSTFPVGDWNIYGFNSTTTGTNYQGYYTDQGSGSAGLNFDTRTQWASNDVPSNANGSNGSIWQGCAMNATNTSLSFKRTGFACGLYQVDVPAHADGFALFINGIAAAQHTDCCDSHTNLWTGILDSGSTVEWQLIRSSAESYLQVAIVLKPQPASQTLWLGGVSDDWFDANNWCNGIPTAATDVLIFPAGTRNMPLIDASGAVAKSITISPAIPAGPFTSLIPAASLTTNAFNLDVYGNWNNEGVFNSNAGSVSFVGSGSGNTITSAATETFNQLTINKPNGITISSGVQQIKSSLLFTNGILTQNSDFRILAGATVSGASDGSYLDGTITKVGNTSFTFPVGKGGFYRPLAISAPANAADEYSARYFNESPNSLYPVAQHEEILNLVRTAEYWTLNRSSGTSNVNITLSWGSNSGVVSDLSLLAVAAWNGTTWTDRGNGGTAGTTTSGTVVTATPSTVYGPFTLAEYKLPVGLNETFTGNKVSAYPNPAEDHFIVELDGGILNAVSIFNNLGQEIICDFEVGSNQMRINTSSLVAGLYVVNVTLDHQPIRLKMMIKR